MSVMRFNRTFFGVSRRLILGIMIFIAVTVGSTNLLLYLNDHSLRILNEKLQEDYTLLSPENVLSLAQIDCPCASNSELFLLVYVFTAPKNYENRMRIRSTYASHEVKKNLSIEVIFILGNPPDDLKTQIYAEAIAHRDMLLHDTVDSYRNLPAKSSMTLEWIHRCCVKVQYLMKTDDDIFLNIFSALKYFKSSIRADDSTFHCDILKYVQVERRTISQYYTTMEEYRYETFPPYCVGFGVLYSRKLVPSLIDGFHRLNSSLFIEDVVSYGFVRLKAGLGLTGMPGRMREGYSPKDILANKVWFQHLPTDELKQNWHHLWNSISERQKNDFVKNSSRNYTKVVKHLSSGLL